MELAQETITRGASSTFTPIPNQLLDAEAFSKLSPAAFKVYAVLRRHSGVDNRPVWPSRERIARLAGMSVSHVKRCLKELETANLIEREERHRQSTIIHFQDWQSEIQKTMVADHQEPHAAPMTSIPEDPLRPPELTKVLNETKELTNASYSPNESQTVRSLVSVSDSEELMAFYDFLDPSILDQHSQKYLCQLKDYVTEHPDSRTLTYPKQWAKKVLKGQTHWEIPRDLVEKYRPKSTRRSPSAKKHTVSREKERREHLERLKSRCTNVPEVMAEIANDVDPKGLFRRTPNVRNRLLETKLYQRLCAILSEAEIKDGS